MNDLKCSPSFSARRGNRIGLWHVLVVLLGWSTIAAGQDKTGEGRRGTPTPPAERRVGIAYTTWHWNKPWTKVWGTPELGQYLSSDRAVISQHVSWLTDAGVDFLLIDWSNNLNYHPGETKDRPDFDMIENSTRALFEECATRERSPRISIMLGCPGEPRATQNGKLTRKADQVYQEYVANPRFRPLIEDYLGKPLLVVYVNTPSPWQHGVPEWKDPRFTVRFMTGFITQQHALMGPGQVSRYGYWSWEDRCKPTYPIVNGHPEAMVVTACWRDDPECRAPGRRHGQTFREQWARARQTGPRFALAGTWNEWVVSEQPSAEISKDIEPSKEHGRLYLDILKEEVRLFKAGKP
jgi:hypothetical protein